MDMPDLETGKCKIQMQFVDSKLECNHKKNKAPNKIDNY